MISAHHMPDTGTEINLNAVSCMMKTSASWPTIIVEMKGISLAGVPLITLKLVFSLIQSVSR